MREDRTHRERVTEVADEMLDRWGDVLHRLAEADKGGPELRFRSLNTTPAGSVVTWGVEGIASAIDRGHARDWVRILEASTTDPGVATDLEHALLVAEDVAVAYTMRCGLRLARMPGDQRNTATVADWPDRRELADALGVEEPDLERHREELALELVAERLRALSSTPSRQRWSEMPIDLAEVDRVAIAGDWHGSIAWATRTIQAAAGAGAPIVLQLGDHAMLWPGADKAARRVNEAAIDAGVEVWLIDGNHDAHPKLRRLEPDERGLGVIRDGSWNPDTPSRLFRVPRGHRFELGGLRFGALGGAYSVDQRWRTTGKDWWPEEAITQVDIDALGDGALDVLLTHEVPAGAPVASQFRVAPDDAVQAQVGRNLVLQAVEGTRPRWVFAGHWHQRVSHRLMHAGGTSQIEVLDCDGASGGLGESAVVLDLVTGSIKPLAG